MRFENPHPLATEDEKNVPAPLQRGVAGEITASRKVRVLDVPLEEATRLTRSGTQRQNILPMPFIWNGSAKPMAVW